MGQTISKRNNADNILSTSDFIRNQKDFDSMSNPDEEIGEENGLILSGILLPEEIIVQILSYADMKSIPKCLLVCKKWNEIVTSSHLWRTKCKRINKIAKNKNLPWFAYYALFCEDFFDKNLLMNNCGQEGFKYWQIKSNGGEQFIVENPPVGAKLLPDAPEFENHTSCFATSYQNCSKYQTICFKNNKLHQKIFDELRPTIYVSEWFAARFDCGGEYKLSFWLKGKSNELLIEKIVEKRVEQWAGSEWNKVEIVLDKYPKGLTNIQFYHKGNDTQFWAGHYGSKMSGAVVKILWNSIAG